MEGVLHYYVSPCKANQEMYLCSAFKISKLALSDGLSRTDIDDETSMEMPL
jgi:hypothetical protein